MSETTTPNPTPKPKAPDWFVERLAEPSTWAGIAAIVAVIAPYIESAARSATLPGAVIAVLSAAVAVLKAETK